MGIDIYAEWNGMSDAEKKAQITGFSVVHGHVGYLREAYHGEPYATKVLVPESFETGRAEIPAETLWERLGETLKTAEQRERVFSNNVKGIRSLRSFLKQQRTALTVPCTLESTGAYHLLVALSLKEAGYRVNCVNPIITKKYMKATVRDAKSDTIDCKRIAELGYHEPNLQRFTVTRDDIAAKGILSALAQLETLRQQLTAHIEHTKEMRQTLGVVIDCKAAAKSLEHMEKQIVAHRARLCELASDDAQTLAANVRGLSLEQASALLIGLGDKTFVDRDQLVAFVGLDVRVRQSGKWQGKQVLSKRGSPYLRKVLFQIGWSLYMNNDAYHEVYRRMRARGKNHKTSIIAVARKFLRFLFAFYWKRTIVFGDGQQPAPVLLAPTPGEVSMAQLSTV